MCFHKHLCACMYTCQNELMCVRIPISVCSRTFTYMHTHVYMCLCTCPCPCTHTCIHTLVCLYISVCCAHDTHTYMCYAHICIPTHVCLHTVCLYVYTCVLLLLPSVTFRIQILSYNLNYLMFDNNKKYFAEQTLLTP